MKRRRGAATVEFALVLVLLLLLLFGMLEIGHALFKWNSAADATRIGARTAAIVAMHDDDSVLAAMNTRMGGELDAANVTVEYSIDGQTFGEEACVRGTCRFVRVTIAYEYHPVLIFLQPGMSILPAAMTMPTFATTVPVEALGAM